MPLMAGTSVTRSPEPVLVDRLGEDPRLSPRWVRYFRQFDDPYLRLTPEEYGALAERCGLHVRRIHMQDKT